eukprot:scpid57628/ scgid2423/ Cytochrome P450 4F6; CYPIVF6
MLGEIPSGLLKIAAIACVSLVLAKIIHLIVSWWLHIRLLKRLVPQPCESHWLRGHLPADEDDAKATFVGYVRKLPRMFFNLIGPVYANVVVCHPETIAEVFQTNPPKLWLVAQIFRAWLGNSILISEGKRWERDHRLISTSFTPAMRREYVGSFKDAACTMLDLWEEQCGRSVNATERLQKMTLDIILKCAMGAETNCQTESNPSSAIVRYQDALSELVKITFERFEKPWLYLDFVFLRTPTGRRFKACASVTQQFSEHLINERRQLLNEEAEANSTDSAPERELLCSTRRKDMLDALLTARDEDNVGLTNTDIREQVETLLVAGHDTTSVAMQWVVLLLSQHQDIQDRCRQEVCDVLQECGGLDNFAHQHLTKLVYVTQTIQEVMRVATIAVNIARTCPKPCTVDGITFPAGTTFLVNALLVHHNQQVWSDPDTFNPDRFAPENDSRPRFAYLPFGHGPRSCIGKHFAMDEMKVILSMILSRFHLLPDPDAPETQSTMAIIVKPDPSVRVLLEVV